MHDQLMLHERRNIVLSFSGSKVLLYFFSLSKNMNAVNKYSLLFFILIEIPVYYFLIQVMNKLALPKTY